MSMEAKTSLQMSCDDIFLLLDLQTTVVSLSEQHQANLSQLIAFEDSPAKMPVQPASQQLITVRPSPWIKTGTKSFAATRL